MLSISFCLVVLHVSYLTGQNYTQRLTLIDGESSSSFPFQKSEILQNGVFKLIYFKDFPGPEQLHSLKEKNIQLISCQSKNTFLAKLPLDLSQKTLHKLGVSRLGNFERQLPIDDISGGRSGMGTWLVVPFPGISLVWAANELEKSSIQVEEIGKELGALEIRATSFEIEKLIEEEWVYYLELIPPFRIPEGWVETAVHKVQHISSSTGIYSGKNVHIAVGDDGWIAPHIDLKGRLLQSPDIDTDIEGSHGDLVSGIIAGNGNLDPEVFGFSQSATLYAFNDFDAVKKAVELYQDQNIVITCTALSDGCNRGYSTLASLADRQIWENPEIMHVFSAGNAGEEDCSYGAGEGWGNITGGVKMAKNVMTVGFCDLLGNPVSSSSRGPASDGRIKPDLVTYGGSVMSTLPDNQTGQISGSSAAAAIVTGVLGQLTEAYRTVFSENPSSDVLKASILNTAEDLGNPGPDFVFGWGKLDGGRAWDLLRNEHFFLDTIQYGETAGTLIEIPENLHEARIMLYWHDREASPTSSIALVNNLDLKVVSPNGDTLLPLVLSSSPDANALNQIALKGVDTLNNAEQVVLKNPFPGYYEILVRGTALPFGPQAHCLVYDFRNSVPQLNFPSGGEAFLAGEELFFQWDWPEADNGKVLLQFSLDDGINWMDIKELAGKTKSYLWTLPSDANAEFLFRIISDNGIWMVQEPCIVSSSPGDLTVTEACGTSTSLRWKSVPEAVGYIIYQLGAERMDSVLFLTDTVASLPILSPMLENWFAVAAVDKKGRLGPRSKSISDGIGLKNCTLYNDLALANILSPQVNVRPDCFDQPLNVQVLVKNEGVNTQDSFTVCYQLEGQPPVCELSTSSIPGGAIFPYDFQNLLSLPGTGSYSLKTWIKFKLDEAPFNDSMVTEITVTPATSFQLPYFETFDNFSLSDPHAPCDWSFHLNEGWINDANGSGDDADWRVLSGATPTLGTGPETDQNTRTSKGRYLYLEGSQGCFEKEAFLLSPCLDLVNAVHPNLSFWYHMSGSHIGKLYIDVFDGEKWIPNVIAPLNGNQGNEWKKAEADLSSFSGKVIIIRFRGLTGTGYLTDIAIDHIALFDRVAAPLAGIISATTIACPGQPITLLDNSFNNPESWEWVIEPPLVEYTGGTSSNSINPNIVFSEPGSYEVSLIVGNDYGEDQAFSQEIIQVTQGMPIPHLMDFKTGKFDALGWKLINEDSDIGWEPILITGGDGQETEAYYLNNHAYRDKDSRDVLESPVIDLNNAVHPVLHFDLSYTFYSEAFEDRFQVLISSDCGASFEDVLFDRRGSGLATAPSQPNSWYPNHPDHWQGVSIDLTNYIGESITLRFVNICGFGNNLFIDNIVIHEDGQFPNAQAVISPDQNSFCINEPLQLEGVMNSNQGVGQYQWRFGPDALPSEVLGPGPHSVVYNTPGFKKIELIVYGSLGYDRLVREVEIVEAPEAYFSYTVQDNNVQFFNQSINGSQYYWDFGDGTASWQKHPLHQFNGEGRFLVSLEVTNACRSTFRERTIEISAGTIKEVLPLKIQVNPNPVVDGSMHLSVESPQGLPFQFELVDLKGVQRLEMQGHASKGWNAYSFDVSKLSSGVYMGKFTSSEKQDLFRLIIIN